MAVAHFSFKFTTDIYLPHDIDSFVEAEVFIPDVKCMRIRGNPTTPELIHVEIEHDDGSISNYEVE
jgi:hypothetical protein